MSFAHDLPNRIGLFNGLQRLVDRHQAQLRHVQELQRLEAARTLIWGGADEWRVREVKSGTTNIYISVLRNCNVKRVVSKNIRLFLILTNQAG